MNRTEIRTPARMVRFIITDTERAVIGRMVMSAPVIAYIMIMDTVMSATVSTIMIRTRIVEMIRIGISNINPERPMPATHINRTEKVGSLHETGILSAAQYPA
mgnify:FL=1